MQIGFGLAPRFQSTEKSVSPDRYHAVLKFGSQRNSSKPPALARNSASPPREGSYIRHSCCLSADPWYGYMKYDTTCPHGSLARAVTLAMQQVAMMSAAAIQRRTPLI